MRTDLPWAIPLNLLVLACLHCAPAADELQEERESATSNQFFENSRRREATALEASRVVHVGGCTAFFLENTAEKSYVMSAQHCFRYDAEAWCAQTKSRSVVENDGTMGRCLRVVASDDRHDLVVLEVTNDHPSTGSSTLRLAAHVPRPDTHLTMVGYPADHDPENPRAGALTTTDECWAIGEPTTSPHANERLGDRSLRHNCSTYGGNSGGPMWVDGTRDVIGLPFTYVPNDYERRAADEPATAAYLALTADFVATHRAELRAAGIAIVEESSAGVPYEPLPPPPVKPRRDAGASATGPAKSRH